MLSIVHVLMPMVTLTFLGYDTVLSDQISGTLNLARILRIMLEGRRPPSDLQESALHAKPHHR